MHEVRVGYSYLFDNYVCMCVGVSVCVWVCL